jgi:prepilin peptidase dependent protein B
MTSGSWRGHDVSANKKVAASPGRPHSQRGLSIIELMVGVAIGLFIIGGAIKLFVDMFGNNRRLLIETRVNQDLRAAADIVARDLRRAGYWQNAASGVGSLNNATNPYAPATITANSVAYAYDRGAGASAAGFSLAGNALFMTVGATSQPVTDPATVRITRFEITNSASASQWFELAQNCSCISLAASSSTGGCTEAEMLALAEGSASRPQVGVRWVDIIIEGESPTTPGVRRQVVESVRLRNDQRRGECIR